MRSHCPMIALTLLLASNSPCDRLPDARRMLEEAADARSARAYRRCVTIAAAQRRRAKAWILSAEAWFALGEDPSARYSAGEAFKLDPLAKPDGQVPAVLADLIEDQRKLQVGDTLQPQDRTGTLVDLSLALPPRCTFRQVAAAHRGAHERPVADMTPRRVSRVRRARLRAALPPYDGQ